MNGVLFSKPELALELHRRLTENPSSFAWQDSTTGPCLEYQAPATVTQQLKYWRRRAEGALLGDDKATYGQEEGQGRFSINFSAGLWANWGRIAELVNKNNGGAADEK